MTSNGKTSVFLTFPAANRIAGTRKGYGFIPFGFGLIEVFDHLLQFGVQFISSVFFHDIILFSL